MKTRHLLLLICFGVSSSLKGQDFTMKRIELADEKVVVHYDLLDTVTGRTYTINVYQSGDNFLNPLQRLTGDAGLEVKPGYNRKIVWDAKTELGPEFSGGVALEIRGRLFIPFVRFTGFDEYQSIKRGKPHQLTWSGGTVQNVLNIDLYKGDRKVTTFPNIANVGHYKLTIPIDVKPGNDYRLRVSDTKNKDEVVYTGTFAVKRKTPLLLKAGAAVLVGSAIGLLLKPAPPVQTIPDPIVP